MKITEIKAIQDLSSCIGSDGCYFICLCACAEKLTSKEIDILRAAYDLINKKVIDYDFKRPKAYVNKMYVTDADKVLSYFGLDNYRIEKRDSLPKDYDGLYIVRYTKEGITHFVLPDYNSITYSSTVKEGRISKYYLIKKVS